MKSLEHYVKKADYFSGPPVVKTLAGGIIGLSTYVVTIAYLAFYFINSYSTDYPISTSVAAFPDLADEAFTMPPMKCVATNGCIVKSQNGGISGSRCTYLAQGDSLPESERKLFYSSDPVDAFTVLSKNTGENFALSYDVETVTKYSNPLETSTLAAAGNFGMYTPMPYKIYRGTSLMNLIETEAVDGTTVNTWMNTVTTENSGFDGTGYCCASTVYNVDGSTNSAKTTEMSSSSCSAGYNSGSGWWGTKIQPPTTYVKIKVQDPLDFGLVIALIGGWLGLLGSIGSLVFWLYEKFLMSEEDNGDKSEAKFSAAPRDSDNMELTNA